jgi:hypothetical protein
VCRDYLDCGGEVDQAKLIEVLDDACLLSLEGARDRRYCAGDGPRPARAGSGLALAIRPAGSAETPGSSVTSCIHFTRHLSAVVVVLRRQSRLMLEGRTRTLSGSSPAPCPASG